MSSTVTTPAVPPYSSTTMAIGWSRRSWSSRRSAESVSGTSSGGTARSPTLTRERRAGGTARASLSVTVPVTSSRLSV